MGGAGAIDLSALKLQTAGAGRAGGGGYLVQVTTASFNEVVAQSQQFPVVLEITSPRAGAEQLSADLEALATEAGGKWLLARVDVDAEVQIAQALGVQGVPMVIGVLMGQPVPLFQGVIPREQISAYLDQLLQAAVANGVVGRAEPVSGGAEEEAEAPVDPRFAAADEAMARGDFVTAEAEFEKLLAETPGDADAQLGKAQAGLLARTGGVIPNEVVAAADAAPTDVDKALAAADVELAILNQPEKAFDRLIALVRVTTDDERERVRTHLLELFSTLGPDPRVAAARRKLTSALF